MRRTFFGKYFTHLHLSTSYLPCDVSPFLHQQCDNFNVPIFSSVMKCRKSIFVRFIDDTRTFFTIKQAFAGVVSSISIKMYSRSTLIKTAKVHVYHVFKLTKTFVVLVNIKVLFYVRNLNFAIL